MQTVVIGLVIFIVLFFLLREVMCWYYKINDLIKLQEEQLSVQKSTQQLLEKIVWANSNAFDNATSANKAKAPKNTPKAKPSEKPVDLEEYNDLMEFNISPEILNKLTVEEINIINTEMQILKENEVIIYNTDTGMINKILRSEFQADSSWVIIEKIADK